MIGPPERISPVGRFIQWMPLVGLCLMSLVTFHTLPAWGFMWAICFALYFGCKWATCCEAISGARPALVKRLGYLFAWPGMDARAFFDDSMKVPPPRAAEWIRAIVNFAAGTILLFVIAPMLFPRHPLGGGWTGMIGLVLMLHFGVFHLLSLAWRRFAKVDAQPIMNVPIRSRSVSEFWNARWNMGFHDLAMRYLFNPIRARFGAVAGLLGTFIASGVLHEWVITMPARGGFGLPTTYFTIQGLAILAERTPRLRRIFRKHGWLGRAFAIAVVVASLGLLFPPVFTERVIVPFLNAIGIR